MNQNVSEEQSSLLLVHRSLSDVDLQAANSSNSISTSSASIQRSPSGHERQSSGSSSTSTSSRSSAFSDSSFPSLELCTSWGDSRSMEPLHLQACSPDSMRRSTILDHHAAPLLSHGYLAHHPQHGQQTAALFFDHSQQSLHLSYGAPNSSSSSSSSSTSILPHGSSSIAHKVLLSRKARTSDGEEDLSLSYEDLISTYPPTNAPKVSAEAISALHLEDPVQEYSALVERPGSAGPVAPGGISSDSSPSSSSASLSLHQHHNIQCNLFASAEGVLDGHQSQITQISASPTAPSSSASGAHESEAPRSPSNGVLANQRPNSYGPLKSHTRKKSNKREPPPQMSSDLKLALLQAGASPILLSTPFPPSTYDYTLPNEVWLRIFDFIPVHDLMELQQVSKSWASSCWTGVHQLDLTGNDGSDYPPTAWIRCLPQMITLSSITIPASFPTDVCLVILSSISSLESLFIHCDEHTSSSGLMSLSRLPKLQKLALWLHSKIRPSYLQPLIPHLSGLTHFKVESFGQSFCERAFTHINIMQNLRTLDLTWCNRLSPTILAQIARLQSLEVLILDKCGVDITVEGIKQLKALPKLKELSLKWCNQLNDSLMPVLADFKLTRLDVSHCQMSPQAVERLRQKVPDIQARRR